MKSDEHRETERERESKLEELRTMSTSISIYINRHFAVDKQKRSVKQRRLHLTLRLLDALQMLDTKLDTLYCLPSLLRVFRRENLAGKGSASMVNNLGNILLPDAFFLILETRSIATKTSATHYEHFFTF